MRAPSTRWPTPSGRDPRRHVVVLRHPTHQLRRMLDLTLTNRVLSAEEAETWGLVNRVVADDDVDTATVELATTLAQGATSALGEAKRVVYNGIDATLETAGEFEAAMITKAMQAPTARRVAASSRNEPLSSSDPEGRAVIGCRPVVLRR